MLVVKDAYLSFYVFDRKYLEMWGGLFKSGKRILKDPEATRSGLQGGVWGVGCRLRAGGSEPLRVPILSGAEPIQESIRSDGSIAFADLIQI